MLPFVGVLLYGFVAFDRLLRIEYKENRSTWEIDGKPVGFFWGPRECSWIRSGTARGRLSFIWLFRTPPWVSHSFTAVKALRHFRLAVLIWNVGVLLSLLVFLSMSRR